MDFALLILRATIGSLMAGHGAQKLFGWFEGPGVKGTSGMMESLSLRPGRQWALVAGASEFGGGVLTLLGFLNPLGPLGVMSSMGMATAKVHWGKPIWATAGGAELPLTNMSVAAAIATAGSGKYSLDHLLRTQLPRWSVLPGVALAAGGIAMGIWSSNRQQQQAAAAAEQQPSEQEAMSV